MGFKKIMLQMPTSGDRKQEKSDFPANGELFFLDLLSHRRPHFSKQQLDILNRTEHQCW
jgi:hypothetical protein